MAQMRGVVEGNGARIATRLSQGRKLGMIPVEPGDMRHKMQCTRVRAQVSMALNALSISNPRNETFPGVFHVAGTARRSEWLAGMMGGGFMATEAGLVGNVFAETGAAKTVHLRKMTQGTLISEN